MRFEMKMPDLATTDSEIRIARWLVETGQKVERGQPIVEVETDKATMEVESVASGVLAEVRAAANDAVSVGQVIAVLEVEGPSPAAAAAVPAVCTAESMPARREHCLRASSRRTPMRNAAQSCRRRHVRTESGRR